MDKLIRAKRHLCRKIIYEFYLTNVMADFFSVNRLQLLNFDTPTKVAVLLRDNIGYLYHWCVHLHNELKVSFQRSRQSIEVNRAPLSCRPWTQTWANFKKTFNITSRPGLNSRKKWLSLSYTLLRQKSNSSIV